MNDRNQPNVDKNILIIFFKVTTKRIANKYFIKLVKNNFTCYYIKHVKNENY